MNQNKPLQHSSISFLILCIFLPACWGNQKWNIEPMVKPVTTYFGSLYGKCKAFGDFKEKAHYGIERRRTFLCGEMGMEINEQLKKKGYGAFGVGFRHDSPTVDLKAIRAKIITLFEGHYGAKCTLLDKGKAGDVFVRTWQCLRAGSPKKVEAGESLTVSPSGTVFSLQFEPREFWLVEGAR